MVTRFVKWLSLFCLTITLFIGSGTVYSQNEDAHIYLIRHGQTEGNKLNRIVGMADIDLNDEGREQAKKLGNYICENRTEYPISQVYTSQLIRARHTGEIIAEINSLPVTTEAGLCEVNFGEWEGKDMRELKEEDYVTLLKGGCFGIETFEDVSHRMITNIRKVAEENRGKHIAIVSHGIAILDFLTSITKEKYGFGRNTSITHVILDKESNWKVVAVNQTPHLPA
jgi:broad specificity phosphatase PhoE